MKDLGNLNGKIDLKGFKLERDRVVGYLYGEGATFLGITINYPLFWKEKYSKERSLEYLEYSIKDYLKNIVFRLDLAEFACLVMEFSNKDQENVYYGYPSIRILACFRNLLEFDEKVIEKIRDEFMEDDIRIDYLRDYKDITEFWNSMTKTIRIGGDWKNFYLAYYREDSNIYGHAGDFIDNEPGSHKCFINCYRGHRDASIEGLNFRLSPSKSTILFNLIRIFMEQNNLFVDNGWIYQRDEKNNSESQIIKAENFFELSARMIKFLSRRFVHQLNEKDLNLLMLESADECLKKMLAVPALLPQRPNKQIADNLVLRKDVRVKV